MKRSSIVVALIASLLTGLSTSARAETWASSSTGGAWNVPANWGVATFPNGPGATANFNAGTVNRTYTYGQDITIGTMNIVSNFGFTNIFSVAGQTTPVITFNSGGAGPATITVTPAAGTNNGTAQSNIIRGDAVFTSDVVVDNPIGTSSAGGTFGFQAGAITGAGGITKNGNGVFTFADSANVAYTGPTIINNGRFRLNGAAKVTATSSILVNSGGQLDLEGPFDYQLGPGTITLNGFGLFNAPAGNFPGAIRTGSGLLQAIENPIVLASTASINVVSTNVSTPGKLNLFNEVSGPGRLIANQKPGLVSREGFLYLAHKNSYSGGTTVEQGTLTVSNFLGTNDASLGSGNVFIDGSGPSLDGNSDAVSSGKLAIETGITDAIADTSYLYLSGGGTAGVADRGYVNLAASVNETVGRLIVGGINGVGATVLGPGTYGIGAANPGLANPDEYFAGTGTITVATPASLLVGDYDNNGVVDARDYITWRKGGPLANDITPGLQSTDYDVWRSRFDATTNPGSGSGLSNSAVPEPASIVLIGSLLSLLALSRRRKVALSLRETSFPSII